MKRRKFLRTVGGATAVFAVGLPGTARAAQNPPAPSTSEPPVPKRTLGRTGCQISVVGFPGLALVHYDQKAGTDGLHKAFDNGVNYFDVAPAYGNGEAETKMGIGLQGLDRDRIFLSCKTKMRDKDGARKELENSLRTLKTDHFDLYQLHHLVRIDEVKQAVGPGGAMETFLKAKEEGKIRFIGFSAHSTKAALEALKSFDFDTVMFPINFVEYYKRDFGRAVLEEAARKGAAVIAIKTMSRGAWPQNTPRSRQWWYRSVEEEHEVNLAWRFTLSRPGVATGIPPSFIDLLDKAVRACRAYREPTETELDELKALAQTCDSIFVREDSMALNVPHHQHQLFPGCPYGTA